MKFHVGFEPFWVWGLLGLGTKIRLGLLSSDRRQGSTVQVTEIRSKALEGGKLPLEVDDRAQRETGLLLLIAKETLRL